MKCAALERCLGLKFIFVGTPLGRESTLKVLSGDDSPDRFVLVCIGVKAQDKFLPACDGDRVLAYHNLFQRCHGLRHCHFQFPSAVCCHRYLCTPALSCIPVPVRKAQSARLIALIELSVVDIVAVWQDALLLLLCCACLFQSDIAEMDFCKGPLIAKIKLHSAVCVAVCCHIKNMLIRLFLCRQIYGRVIQIADIALVRRGDARDHGACFVRIGIVGQFVLCTTLHRQVCLYHLHAVIYIACTGRGDVQRIAGNLRLCLTATGKQQPPVGFLLGQILRFCKITVYNVVSGLVRISELHFIFRLIHIQIIAVLLIHSDIINDKLCVVAKHGILVGISYPASADCQIQYHVKRLIIRCRICALSKSCLLGKPVVHCIEQHVIHIEAELIRIPLTGEYMEVLAKILLSVRQCIAALLLCVRLSEMKRSVSGEQRASMHLHHVNLAALWPLAIIALVCGHHPECRQEAFAAWHLCPHFKSAVLEIMLSLCIDSARCVIRLAVNDLLDCLNIQIAILYIGIFRRISIFL